MHNSESCSASLKLPRGLDLERVLHDLHLSVYRPKFSHLGNSFVLFSLVFTVMETGIHKSASREDLQREIVLVKSRLKSADYPGRPQPRSACYLWFRPDKWIEHYFYEVRAQSKSEVDAARQRF